MISDLKEFERFLKICRKQGVDEVSFAGLSVKLGNLPTKSDSSQSEDVPTDGLTDDELMFHHIRSMEANQ